MSGHDILIGIDAGTSVIKAVAFDLAGRQLATASVANRYQTGAGGAATQSLSQTWADCVAALRGLAGRIDGLAGRTAALSVTAQGDGTWLVGRDGPVGDAWLWLDARAAPTVARLAGGAADRGRFEATGTGLNTCQQGAQMAHMDVHAPELLDHAEVALHCKDWLYLNLTGIRATDPSEASFTFGNFRTRRYDEAVIDALGLGHRRALLPEIVEGTDTTHPLCAEAAALTGLRAGTPVCLGYVDMVMTALGAGVHGGGAGDVACSTVGSTGVHLRAVRAESVHLNPEGTGYVICLPVPGLVTQVQTNMAATLNIDWVLGVAAGIISDMGQPVTHRDLVGRIDGWLAQSRPGQIVYHPYISEAGERGPFVNADARAGFVGLNATHRFPDLLRAVADGLGMAMRDCYAAMGPLPGELRLTGGAARSPSLRAILSASLNAAVRVSARDEAGAAGAAMMAAVAIGAYPDMEACIADWVTPLLGAAEPPDPDLVLTYDRLFPAFSRARSALPPAWQALSEARDPSPKGP
ncbi:FGGY-family carbohydrate kinase [Paracoccus spongiarum]|uniref:FGGY-family carbohydrate kinase n=1 Tax=Paracoccus spongiarum TaxID=3064387 RepID=A0ABT9JAD9_9RHOB|nr:FGGY-family carbohydrate kinase [Paracoccus sp. 2205BS29-5]MDP5306061.1 FGGY-family carbohydrate kinase [Paracoccus sp. 2205BS29-5]